ncbi:manganese and iron superoxide dismutase [Tothia fuscella]|uniref:Manganese and iron superoxide dismutase n=1 Tax=Tothia fuscella TaxID=1048955 RepID=A0A9P4P0S7_9PEZI|nr:manganese and iron superoxide dismutase [Tothia fuscella]
MNLQRICWRQGLKQSSPNSIRQYAQAAYAPQRYGLTVPLLNDEETIVRTGIKDLYTPMGVKYAWTDYQAQMVKRVNELTAEGTLYGKSMKQLLIETARNPQQAALFNHASMAWNNHFYFESITHNFPVEMPKNLERSLINDFSSISTLRAAMIATANAMFGPGFVWLVRTNVQGINKSPRRFKILSTYAAGSPLSGAHNRRQPLDMNTQNVGTATAAGLGPGNASLQGLSEAEFRRQTEVQNHVGFQSHNQTDTSFGGVALTPVLCVNTWQHAWMIDYSAYGKESFLTNWWDHINWDVVMQRSGLPSSEKQATEETRDTWGHGNNSFMRR